MNWWSLAAFILGLVIGMGGGIFAMGMAMAAGQPTPKMPVGVVPKDEPRWEGTDD